MRITLIALALLGAMACKSRRKQVQQGPRDFGTPVFTSGAETDSLLRIAWEHFSARLEVDYYNGEEALSGNISLRMRRDSILWFSVSASIGLQVAKGIITQDSVKILDLYEKKYYRYGIKELGNLLGAGVGLRELQNTILANPVFDTVVYRKENKSGGWFGSQSVLTNVLFAKYFSMPDSSYIVQEGSMRQLKAAYKGNKSAGAFVVPEFMTLWGMSDSKTIRLDAAFTTASDAAIPSYPFKVPEDYETGP